MQSAEDRFWSCVQPELFCRNMLWNPMGICSDLVFGPLFPFRAVDQPTYFVLSRLRPKSSISGLSGYQDDVHRESPISLQASPGWACETDGREEGEDCTKWVITGSSSSRKSAEMRQGDVVSSVINPNSCSSATNERCFFLCQDIVPRHRF